MADTVRTCIGIDVGGTFTDCVLTDGTSTWRAKAPTTTGEIGLRRAGGSGARGPAERHDPRRAAAQGQPLRPGHHGRDQHAGLAHRPPRRTAGHQRVRRDDPHRRRAHGSSTRTAGSRPPNILAHRTIAAIEERIDRNGAVVVPLDPDQVKAAVRRLVEEEGVEAIAVSFVWSFANPDPRGPGGGRHRRDLSRPAGGLGRRPAPGHPRVRAHHLRRPQRLRLGRVRRYRGARRRARSSGDCKARSSSCTRAEARSRSERHAGDPSAWPCRGRPPALPPRSP